MFDMADTDARDTRARVIEAAGALFAARGFHGTTLRDIAARAEVNLAAAHYHVGSKEDLYLEVLRAQFAAILAELEQRGARLPAATASKAALSELLRARIAAMLALLLGPPPGLHGTLMMREMCDPSAALSDIVEQFIQPQRREMEAIVSRLFPALEAHTVERCVFSIVGQVLFYRQMLPALRVMIGPGELDAAWMETAAAHIATFSLGGMQRLAAAGRPQRRRRR